MKIKKGERKCSNDIKLIFKANVTENKQIFS